MFNEYIISILFSYSVNSVVSLLAQVSRWKEGKKVVSCYKNACQSVFFSYTWAILVELIGLHSVMEIEFCSPRVYFPLILYF